jgi:hypothetical protein
MGKNEMAAINIDNGCLKFNAFLPFKNKVYQ